MRYRSDPCFLSSRSRRLSSSVQENLRRGEGDLADLLAINIERGRERGVASYLTYRNLGFCGLPRVTSFDQLVTVAGFLKVDVTNLKRVYKDVRDIDLFSAGEFQIHLIEYSKIDGKIMVIFGTRR